MGQRISSACNSSTPRQTGLPKNDAGTGNGLGELLVVVGKRLKRLPCGGVQGLDALGNAPRREPIGLGEDRVKADSGSSPGSQSVDQLGDDGARPWPLAKRLQCALVNINDRDRVVRDDAGMSELVEVEGHAADVFERRRVPETQRHEYCDQRRAGEPSNREISCQPTHQLPLNSSTRDF